MITLHAHVISIAMFDNPIFDSLVGCQQVIMSGRIGMP